MAERETERVIVTDDGGGGGGGSSALIIVIVIIALLAVAYFAFGRGLLNGGTQKIDANVKVDTPTGKGG